MKTKKSIQSHEANENIKLKRQNVRRINSKKYVFPKLQNKRLFFKSFTKTQTFNENINVITILIVVLIPVSNVKKNQNSIIFIISTGDIGKGRDAL